MAENETPPSPDKGDPNLPLLKTNGSESTPPKAEVYGLQESPAPIPQTIQPTKGTQPSQIVTKPAKQGSDGFRELLETIVFVLVLVLVQVLLRPTLEQARALVAQLQQPLLERVEEVQEGHRKCPGSSSSSRPS